MSIDIQEIVKLQHKWIRELQNLTSERILEQHSKNSSWLPVDFCGKLLWTRSILPNELLLDIDFSKPETSLKWTERIVVKLDKLDLPHFVFFTGSRGFHISVFFRRDDDINWMAARVEFLKYLKFNKKYKIDLRKVSFRKRSMVRIIGSKKKESDKYRKTYLSQGTDGDFREFYVGFPKVEVCEYPGFLKERLPNPIDSDSCSVKYYGCVKGGDEKCFNILNRKLKVGERNNGLVSIILLLKSVGLSEKEIKREVVRVAKRSESEVGENRDDFLDRSEWMVDYILKQKYHFSCKEFRSLFPDLCDRCKSKERSPLVVE